ncbi:hypothetical protein BDZ89DRAFT_1136823 [Hymenopellis radicata]|nr:hypothetical protein BDZ89DRAFT_1136823 [Hymenopellis radicata]
MALRLLQELLDEPLSVFASLTLDVCIRLEKAKRPSWLGDLKWVLKIDLPQALVLPTDLRSCTAADVEAMMKMTYLLWNRLEPFSPPDKPAYRAIYVRHYLQCPPPSYQTQKGVDPAPVFRPPIGTGAASTRRSRTSTCSS